MSCMCKNELNLDKLCVDCIKAGCERVHKLVADNICTQALEVKTLSVENETANNICVPGKIQATEVWADKSYSNSSCAKNATLDNACITNLTVGSLNNCVKWRAASTFNTNTVYTLGSAINWNVILDDPNGNIALSPFTYTVPQTGYYIVTFHMDHNSLSGAANVNGIPIGNQIVLVNGNDLRSQYTSFLGFSDVQKTSLTSLCLLNAGDVITMKYQVLVFDTTGLVPYVGTVTIESNGMFPGQSGFGIHYLSSLNCEPITCQPCSTVTIPCTPVTTPCQPVGGDDCDEDNGHCTTESF